MATVRRRVTAHGHVQGVFFRDSTRQEAERRGVAGSVRNTGEGTVEAVFEGDEAAVDALRMEAATPLRQPRITVLGNRVLVDGLAIEDATAVDLVRSREEAGDDPARVVADAVEIGA